MIFPEKKLVCYLLVVLGMNPYTDKEGDTGIKYTFPCPYQIIEYIQNVFLLG